MYRRTLLAGVGVSLLAGCTERFGAPVPNPDDATEETTGEQTAEETTTGGLATTPGPTGPIDPAGGIQRVRLDDDSASVYLDGYDSSKYAEARFLRATDSAGVPAELSRSQVTSAPQLQNALAYFGPNAEEVSVRMPLSDGYALSDALDSYWKSADDAAKNADDEKVYRFEDLRFTVLTVYYD